MKKASKKGLGYVYPLVFNNNQKGQKKVGQLEKSQFGTYRKLCSRTSHIASPHFSSF